MQKANLLVQLLNRNYTIPNHKGLTMFTLQQAIDLATI